MAQGLRLCASELDSGLADTKVHPGQHGYYLKPDSCEIVIHQMGVEML